jgi:hypothetical protein
LELAALAEVKRPSMGGFAVSNHRTAVILFAVALVIAVVGAFLTTLHHVDTRQASSDAQPGTIGLARPHPPLYPSQPTQK